MSMNHEVMPIVSDYMPNIDSKMLPINLGDLCRINEEFERIHAQRTRVMVAILEMELEDDE